MSLNLDETGSIKPAVPEPRPKTIFEDHDVRPENDKDRLEKKINGVLYFLRRSESRRKWRAFTKWMGVLAVLAAVGYSYWPQLRDADWDAVGDTATRAVAAFRDRQLGDFISGEFGVPTKQNVLSGKVSGSISETPRRSLPEAHRALRATTLASSGTVFSGNTTP